jgi:hypothetical protein
MTLDEILTYIKDPRQLDLKTLQDIEMLVDQYPWFSTGHLLLLKNIQHTDTNKVKKQLKTSSIFINNKNKLLDFLDLDVKSADKATQPIQAVDYSDYPGSKSKQKDEDIFIFNDNGELAEECITIEALNNYDDQNPENTTLLELDYPKKEEKSDQIWPSKNKLDLIDSFIKNEPGKIKPDANKKSIEDLSKESIKENNDYLTETLADIYIKQGHYKKAKSVYQKLSLKYPKKSDYFAQKIEEVNKLFNKS